MDKVKKKDKIQKIGQNREKNKIKMTSNDLLKMKNEDFYYRCWQSHMYVYLVLIITVL